MFIIGQKVVLLHTGEKGKVSGIHQDGMLDILLEGGEIIPVDKENLVYEHLYSSKDALKNNLQDQKHFTYIQAPQFGLDSGFFLCFDPYDVLNPNANFKIFCVNDSNFNFNLDIILYLKGEQKLFKKILIKPYCAAEVDDLLFHDLSENPRFLMQFDLDKNYQKEYSFRIKPSKFFQNFEYISILNKSVYFERIWERPDPAKGELKSELKKYTKGLLQHVEINPLPVPRKANEIWKYAQFNAEIDLHIEALTDKHRGLSNEKIVGIQLAAFDQFIHEAIEHGVNRVYIIHGVGKGSLKKMVHDRLLQLPFIKEYKNEYHPNYGFGATEVLINK